jgi:hypothetical protein
MMWHGCMCKEFTYVSFIYIVIEDKISLIRHVKLFQFVV